MFDLIKRLMDIVGGVIGLIIFSPIMLVTAILIKLESRGPVLADIPQRVGRGGRMFRMYKFRSMINDAHKVLHTDPKFKKLLEQYKKSNFKLAIKDDPRITRVGKWIREWSIDELSQVVNIIKGEMSLVGPRAYFADELREYQEKNGKVKKYVKELMTTKPGLTGLWQVSGRSDVDFEERLKMDAWYARQKSLWLDVKILLKTPLAVLQKRGSW